MRTPHSEHALTVNGGLGEPPPREKWYSMPLRMLAVLAVPFYLGAKAILQSRWKRLAQLFSRTIYGAFLLLFHGRLLRNLSLAFRSSAALPIQIGRMGCDYRRQQSRMLIEVAGLMKMSPTGLIDWVGLVGEEHLQNALRHGRGVLLLGAHFGTWYCAQARLAAGGYPVTTLAVKISLRPLQRDLDQMRQRFFVQTVAMHGGGSRVAAEVFARNGVFATMCDVGLRNSTATLVPFGDAWLRVDLGPARLALRHEVPVLMALCEPLDDRRLLVRILPMEGGPDVGGAEELAASWGRRLFHEIKARPELWWGWSFLRLRSSRDAVQGKSHIPHQMDYS